MFRQEYVDYLSSQEDKFCVVPVMEELKVGGMVYLKVDRVICQRMLTWPGLSTFFRLSKTFNPSQCAWNLKVHVAHAVREHARLFRNAHSYAGHSNQSLICCISQLFGCFTVPLVFDWRKLNVKKCNCCLNIRCSSCAVFHLLACSIPTGS